MAILTVEDLYKSYRKGFIPRQQTVLNGVNFTLQPGTITGFLGANGAGKTTTMKCVLGLAQFHQGKVSFFEGQPLNQEVKNRIGFLPERPYFYEYLTGEEFLKFYGQLSLKMTRFDLQQRITNLLELVGLTEARHRRLRAYSKGMLQKIGFAQALVHRPDLVILDEPVSGLDPDGRMAIAELIKQVASEGAAVFFSSHLMHDTEKLCQNLIILRSGKVMYEGAMDLFLEKMGISIEIIYFENNQKKSLREDNIDSAQRKIKILMGQGASILEVRQNRKSLEEAFVQTALRGSAA
ncbi:MAG: ABC transporter ATP-binding protein [Bdellovibrionales bacterium]|nr:ABC transporter ATP-binding protein [Bdellovibrionales bacterium]